MNRRNIITSALALAASLFVRPAKAAPKTITLMTKTRSVGMSTMLFSGKGNRYEFQESRNGAHGGTEMVFRKVDGHSSAPDTWICSEEMYKRLLEQVDVGSSGSLIKP